MTGRAETSGSRVLLNHDAAIDEFMATILLTTMDGVDLTGIVVTNADCVYGPAMQTAWRIQSFIGATGIPLGLSRARGYNPFPWEYRGDAIKEAELPALSSYGPHAGWPPYPDGDALMAELLEAAPEKSVTLLVTCPMTTLEGVLKKHPHLAAKIERMIWMGGAMDVPGNLDPATLPPGVANPYAEWNAFWDPYAVDWIFRNTDFPLIVFPLDVTDQAAITDSFMARLLVQGKRFRTSNLAYQSYELVSGESFYDMWDVVTTCYIPHPEFFAEPEETRLAIVTDGDQQGMLIRSDSGRKAQVVLDLKDPDGFYDYVLGQFAR